MHNEMHLIKANFGAIFVKIGQAVETGQLSKELGLEAPPPFGSLISLDP